MKVRIGIDVGGTFTDAAVINNETYELVGSSKVPTTHNSTLGVAEGIIQVLNDVLKKYRIDPSDVVFIAHGTTQATNALLEGDVSKVGVITVGQGVEGLKSKRDTSFGDIKLTNNKYLSTENQYIDLKEYDGVNQEIAENAILNLKNEGCESLVAAEAFSVNNPNNENYIVEISEKNGLAATATNEISKLYGLKVRTKTAIINASIMPKMLETANMTESSIKESNIKSQLMVMRCDGGVMSIEEVRKRPILTILSGPSAGVAGALMYEKLTDGIFLEVGGTSTDISCVKDGKVMIKYAEVGDHKTYINSLDVRTVGIGGGSMIQFENNKIVGTGPRSAHIAGLDYEVYADPSEIVNPVLKVISPINGDPDYCYIECLNNKKYCLTLSGAANILGYINEGDYARGNVESARKAWEPLATKCGLTIEEAAKAVMDFAAKKNSEVVNKIIGDYDLNPRSTIFVGGGGGASVVVPHLGEYMNYKYKVAKNAPVISTIGVALAMVREVVERTVANPTEEDILEIRREVERAIINSGANSSTVEISVEVDNQRNLIRGTAIGTTELRTKDLSQSSLETKDLLAIVADNLGVSISELSIVAQNKKMKAVVYKNVSRKFGIFKKISNNLRLIDNEGVIRLQKNNANVFQTTKDNYLQTLNYVLDEYTEYNDGGAQLPNIYIVNDLKIIDVSGLQTSSQVIALADIELASTPDDETLIIISTSRAD